MAASAWVVVFRAWSVGLGSRPNFFSVRPGASGGAHWVNQAQQASKCEEVAAVCKPMDFIYMFC